MHHSNEIEKLIYLFSKLPGLGSRSARRIVLHLLQEKEIRLKTLLEELTLVFDKTQICQVCNNIDSSNICKICASNERDSEVVAIVETVAELWAIERSGIFKGKYHVLGTTLSANNCSSPDELHLSQLLQRCQLNSVTELIIATNATLDGQTTAYYITEYFKGTGIHISRPANGIPIGGELDYLDENTLSLAINQRQPF